MTRSQHSARPPGVDVPAGPAHLSGGSWLVAAKRAVKEYKADDLQDRAAALTYFGIQSIFPGLLVLVSLLGILGKSATQPLITNLGRAVPSSVRMIIMTNVTRLQHSHAASGIVGIAGILLALWAASNYVAAFMRASNVIYDVPEARPVWKTAPIRLGVTVVTMILLVAAALIVVVTGGLARKVGNVLGVGSTAVTVWDIAKWPVLLIIIGLILAILFWASPERQARLPVGQPWRLRRDRALADGLCPVRCVRRQLRPLQQGLRQPGRRHHLPDLDVDLQRRRPARRRVQRRA